jgi:hypothetical protein
MVGASVSATAVNAVVRVYLAKALVLLPRTFARLQTGRGHSGPGISAGSEQTLPAVVTSSELR